MKELIAARYSLGIYIQLLTQLNRTLDGVLSYTVDLSPQEAQSLSLMQDRITRALTILKEPI
jgi:hypothetical protein